MRAARLGFISQRALRPSSSVMEPEALHGTMINLCIQSWPLICRTFEKWRCIVAASGCFRAAFWYLPGQNRHTESRMIIKIRAIDFRNTALTSGQKNHNMIYRSRLYPSMLLGGHQGMNYHMTMADHFSQNPKEMPSWKSWRHRESPGIIARMAKNHIPGNIGIFSVLAHPRWWH